jgi:4-diphosphocytidyl-2-C-methyl-D-erythritol kinase
MLYDLSAPAKLNLFLHVIGRRADGYHLLQTVFRLIDLADTLHIDSLASSEIERETDMPDVAVQDDLVVKAAIALRKATGVKRGARIVVQKKIPAGGGLGGGSSDAATVLIALNRLWQTRLSRKALMEIGLKLGADVPFFIFGQNAFAQGVGEDLTALELPEQSYAVVQPMQGVPTAGVFQSPDLTRNTPEVKIMDFSGLASFVPRRKFDGTGSGALTAVNTAGCASDVVGFGRNDLQAVVLSSYPAMQSVWNWLFSAGFDARMTGSGACFFAEAPTFQQAILLREKMLAKMHTDSIHVAGGEQAVPIQAVFACRGLAEHPLRDWVES